MSIIVFAEVVTNIDHEDIKIKTTLVLDSNPDFFSEKIKLFEGMSKYSALADIANLIRRQHSMLNYSDTSFRIF